MKREILGSSTEAGTRWKYHVSFHAHFKMLNFQKKMFPRNLFDNLLENFLRNRRYQAECLFCTWLTLKLRARKFERQVLPLSLLPFFPIFLLPVLDSFLSPSGFIECFPAEERNRTDKNNLHQSASPKEAGAEENGNSWQHNSLSRWIKFFLEFSSAITVFTCNS